MSVSLHLRLLTDYEEIRQLRCVSASFPKRGGTCKAHLVFIRLIYLFDVDSTLCSLALCCRDLCLLKNVPSVAYLHPFQRRRLLQTSSCCLKTNIFVWWYIVYACFVMSALAVLADWSTPSEQIHLLLSLHPITTCIFPETLWFLCAFHLHLHSSFLNVSGHRRPTSPDRFRERQQERRGGCVRRKRKHECQASYQASVWWVMLLSC